MQQCANESRRKYTIVVLLGFALYILSSGPMWWLAEHAPFEREASVTWLVFYSPLLLPASLCPSTDKWLDEYIKIFDREEIKRIRNEAALHKRP